MQLELKMQLELRKYNKKRRANLAPNGRLCRPGWGRESPLAVGAATKDAEASRRHLSAAARASRARRRAGSDRISFWRFRARPGSAGRQSQVRRDTGICLLLARGGKHKRDKGPGPAARRRTPRSAPAPLLCPSSGRFLQSPPGLPPSQQQQNRLTPEALARRSAERPISAQRRAGTPPPPPRGRVPLPSPHDSLPAGGTLSTANVIIFVMNDFCEDGGKENYYYNNNFLKNNIFFNKAQAEARACGEPDRRTENREMTSAATTHVTPGKGSPPGPEDPGTTYLAFPFAPPPRLPDVPRPGESPPPTPFAARAAGSASCAAAPRCRGCGGQRAAPGRPGH